MKYKINQKLAYRKIQDEVYIVDVKNSLLYKLNPTATLVWESIKNGDSIDEIVDKIVREYEVDTKTASEDVKDLIVELEQKGLIVKV